MADTGVPPNTANLPPPPQPNTGAPGFDNTQGPSNPAHMPPPPLHIPQNTNPIPTAITSPMGGDKSGIMSPSSGGGFARRAAPEPNKRALYVGGLDVRVTEDVLRQIFETTGHVQNVKIIPDKNVRQTLDMRTILSPFCCLAWINSIYRLKAITMASSSTMIQAQLSALCRP